MLSGSAEFDLGYSTMLAPGRSLRAALDGDGAQLTISDATVERKAVWAAIASTKYSDLASPKLGLLRRWSF